MFRISGPDGDAWLEAEASGPGPLFEDLALGLYALSCGAAGIAPAESRRVSLSAESPQALAVAFLNELVFLMDTEGFVASSVKAEVSLAVGCAVGAELSGETGAFARRKGILVKAATYHGMEIGEKDGSWKAKIMLDI